MYEYVTLLTDHTGMNVYLEIGKRLHTRAILSLLPRSFVWYSTCILHVTYIVGVCVCVAETLLAD